MDTNHLNTSMCLSLWVVKLINDCYKHVLDIRYATLYTDITYFRVEYWHMYFKYSTHKITDQSLISNINHTLFNTGLVYLFTPYQNKLTSPFWELKPSIPLSYGAFQSSSPLIFTESEVQMKKIPPHLAQ